MSVRRGGLTRRDLLRAGLASTVGGSLLGTSAANALLFGEAPAEKAPAMLVEDRRVESILEVFLFGGISQYESLYCIEEFGKNDATQFHAFSTTEIENAMGDCGITGSPALLQPFATDGNGLSVKLGPFAMPLRLRPDLLERLRICVTAHDLEPHEAAVPVALTGRSVGHAVAAGLGACVERYQRERNPGHQPPYAYVLRNQSPILFDLTRPALATGIHPAGVRPLSITVDAPANVALLLERKTLGADKASFDALVNANVERYNAGLRWKGGDALRSVRLSDLRNAAETVRASDAIREVLKPELFEPIASDYCTKSVAHDVTRTGLRLAAHLLTHPTAPARYVCLVDGGYFDTSEKPPQAGGYDTHENNCTVQSRNLHNLFSALTETINAPGENDPSKLDLDRTLIILNTEFGRTPAADPLTKGRGHWPYGYPVAYLGGPIRADNRGVFGAVGADARAITSITPREHRVAALLALGIWPFAPETYNVSDVADALHEAEAVRSIIERVLGVA